MSIFIKKNIYDKFKINSSKCIQRPSSLKEKKSFSANKNNSQLYLLSKILKGTKSILKNKKKFSGYMNEYQSIVSKSTFKRPDIQEYPLLRKEVSCIIPIKSQIIENQKTKKIIKNLFEKKVNYESFKEKFIHSQSINMSSIENKHIKYYLKLNKEKKSKDKLVLFSDFFHKWNNNYQYQFNNDNNKERFSPLCYDEKKIFFNDYSHLLKEKLCYLQKNKLENMDDQLKINILDGQKKKIMLNLISMKLIFSPLNDDKIKYDKKDYNFEDYQEINEESQNNNNEINKNKNVITLPLSYVFLFYSNNHKYFQDILLSSIKFSNGFQKVLFDINEINSILRRDKAKNTMRIQRRPNHRVPEHKGSIKLLPKPSTLFKKSIFLKLSNKEVDGTKEENKKEKDKNVNFSFKDLNNDSNNIFDSNKLYRTNKRIITIHSNLDLRKKEKNKNEPNSSNTQKKDIKYTEYSFIWETPNKTYRVRMIMPIIIFWSEHIKKNIIVYCDKDLFLFLLQNNFINWDYYVLNYLFSIKAFRQIILSGLSFYNNNYMNSEKKSSFARDIKNRTYSSVINKNIVNSLFSYINEKTIILNMNKKIYNQLNPNNESYKFFYTDNFGINSIIDFHSYHIFIEYDKLNSKICWEFALNFRQMNYLSNISKYQQLETFLPKIIKTNFEDGTLTMDFSVFDYFNAKILGHKETIDKEEKFKTSNTLINININDEKNTKKKIYNGMILVIKMPFLIVEQYVKSRFLSNNITKIGLNSNFLNSLDKSQIFLWSKKILKLISNKNGQFDPNKSSLNLIKDSLSFNEDNRNDYDDYLNIYHKYKKTSKSLHYRKKKNL